MALYNYPYGTDVSVRLVSLRTILSGDSSSSYPGGYVNLTASVADEGGAGAVNVVVTFQLSPGLRLAGPPAYTLGTGCTGTSAIVCNISYLRSRGALPAVFRFGVQVTRPDNQVVTASAVDAGDVHSNTSSFAIAVS